MLTDFARTEGRCFWSCIRSEYGECWSGARRFGVGLQAAGAHADVQVLGTGHQLLRLLIPLQLFFCLGILFVNSCNRKYRCLWNTNAPLPQHIMTNMTFESDLDLWPTDLKINRDHLLIKDYLPTKFEASGANPSWVISCTRLRETHIPTDRRTDGPTCATQYAPPFSKGGINIFYQVLLNIGVTIHMDISINHNTKEIYNKFIVVPHKMTFEVAILGNFPDIPELKLSLPFWVMERRMWRCKYVRLAELSFLYFL